MSDPLLSINDLRIVFKSGDDCVEAVSGASLSIQKGEVIALVGESGSGKTVTALAVTRLLPINAIKNISGRILFHGHDLLGMPESELRRIRGRQIAYVFQEPGSALNPVFTVGYQIEEALRLQGRHKNRREKIADLLESVGIREPGRVANAYPHQLSGGQQQRVMLAMALAGEPELLIADEPTTALDVTVQAQILELLKQLQSTHNMAVMLITHNLAIAAAFTQRIAVMYAGQIVETGISRELIHQPRHPYTKALLNAVPRLRGTSRLDGIPGQIPSGSAWPSGCRFHPRCTMARDTCRLTVPEIVTTSNRQPDEADHDSRCFFWSEVERS